ncbi:MAG: DUF3842 family protein [Clostridia bacterium]
MKVVVIDGQGGGIGKALVEQLKHALPDQPILAVGTNALATTAMLRAGAEMGATGENAVRVCARDADVIVGPIGIVLADAMMGEITPEMAQAVGASSAQKILVMAGRCHIKIAGWTERPVGESIQDAVHAVCVYAEEKGENA